MKLYQQNRAGWTMIELIFVIVIIGILSSLVLPKLAATRDDAKLSVDVSNMLICIKDTSTYYMATGLDYSEETHSSACNDIACYDFTYAINGVGFNVSTKPTGTDYCTDIEYVGGHLAKSYTFGGSSVKR